MSPILRNLLAFADAVAAAHGLPLEAPLFHMCAMGSALAGDLVSSKPDGGPSIPAKFSAVFRTPDLSAPRWVAVEWMHLERRQQEFMRLPASPLATPQSIAALRRQKRGHDFVTHGTGEGPGMAAALLEFRKNRKSYRHIDRVHGSGRPKRNSPHRSTTFLAEGHSPLRAIANSHSHADGYWNRLTTGLADRSTVLGWIGTQDCPVFHRVVGSERFATLGWSVSCPASQIGPDDVPPRLLAEATLQRLEMARFGSTRFPFEPPQPARELLDRQVEEFRAIVGICPPCSRELIVPDIFLGWHLSAILSALCCDGRGDEFQLSLYQASRVGIAVAGWVFQQHVDEYRHAFPADEFGRITGQDLRVFRFLNGTPSKVREIQRRLRGVCKASCLASLRRAVGSGLVVETDHGEFGLALPPSLSAELSEFLSEFDPNSIFPLQRGPKTSASTDNHGQEQFYPTNKTTPPTT